MFENFRKLLKLHAMRSNKTKLVNVDMDNHIVTLKNGWYNVKVSFKLVHYDNEMYVAFSGDVICSDADCLTRLSKLLWNYEFPTNFHPNQMKLLTEQVRKAKERDMYFDTEEEQSADEEVLAEDNQDGNTESTNDIKLETSNPTEEKIFFRDLHDYIFGNPNNVLVTLRVYKEIDD